MCLALLSVEQNGMGDLAALNKLLPKKAGGFYKVTVSFLISYTMSSDSKVINRVVKCKARIHHHF